MPHLFDPFTLKGITLRNRIGMSPMCQYSCDNGFANEWHKVHLGSRAIGGAALIIVEATAVEDRGRISPFDMGIWTDAHADALAPIAAFVTQHGAVPGIQIAHAGRKASTQRPWDTGHNVPDDQGGWPIVAPSAIPFAEDYRVPKALTRDDIREVQHAFRDAAVRAHGAGFRWLEIHAAHGYLLHSFMSPISNQREDEYGGSFENRIRFTLETTRLIRAAWPDDLPLAVRLSCTDWIEGGWTLEESIELAKRLKAEGVDLIDCSSGGIAPHQKINTGAGYQVPFADAIRRQAGIATAAVGLISDPMQAAEVIHNERADIVLLARELLRDPYWPVHAAQKLHRFDKSMVPPQYWRGH